VVLLGRETGNQGDPADRNNNVRWKGEIHKHVLYFFFNERTHPCIEFESTPSDHGMDDLLYYCPCSLKQLIELSLKSFSFYAATKSIAAVKILDDANVSFEVVTLFKNHISLSLGCIQSLIVS
jgi:hypothetical protein